MKKLNFILIILLCYACSPRAYTIYEVKSSNILMDSAFDKNANPKTIEIVDYYSNLIKPMLSEVIGEVSHTMTIEKPERELVYFTLNVIKQYGDKNISGGVDFALMNINGHRANLNEGSVTMGDMYEIYSFDNTLVSVELQGKDLPDIFKNYAKALCSNVNFTITKDGDITDIFINNMPLNPDKTYKIITLDYLAKGGDDMAVMKNASNFYDTGILIRDVMISYVKECTKNNKKIE